MTKIIQFQDYLDANVVLDPARQLLLDNQQDLALENQQLLSEIMTLEGNLENQTLITVNLKSQLKELQVENEILLDALEADEDFLAPVLLTDSVQETVHVNEQQANPSQTSYFEKEYSMLKDKIRHVEQALVAKDESLKQAHTQTEQLLNELLAKG